MSGLAICLALLVVALSLLVIALSRQVWRLSEGMRVERAHHDACHAQAESLILMASAEMQARALESAAIAWESAEEQPHLRRLAEEKYRVGGPNMPTIWMLDRADKIRNKKGAMA